MRRGVQQRGVAVHEVIRDELREDAGGHGKEEEEELQRLEAAELEQRRREAARLRKAQEDKAAAFAAITAQQCTWKWVPPRRAPPSLRAI